MPKPNTDSLPIRGEEVDMTHTRNSHQIIRLQEEPANSPAQTRMAAPGLTRWRQLITVEPITFLFLFAIGIHEPASNSLTYRKVCHHLIDDEYICNNLKNKTFTIQEDIVQRQSSHQFLYQTLCFELPAIVCSFFYGSISDHFSRRLALILPLIGQSIVMGSYIICATYEKSRVEFLLIGNLISGFFGGWITCFMAAFSYLSEVTTTSTRTSRIAIAEGASSLAIGLSYFVSGVLLDNTSYIFVFSLSLCIYLLGAIYIYTWLQEPKLHHNLKENWRLLCSSISWVRVKDSFTCMFKFRPNCGRKRLLTGLACVFTTMLSYNALYTVGYLYLKRQPLSWSQTMFGVYVGYFNLIKGLALFTVVQFMKHRLRMADCVIMVWALATSSASELMFGLSTKTWLVFLVPIVGLLGDAKGTCLRSILSQFVNVDEQGQMFAALGSLQSLSGMAGALVFNTLYPHTLTFWPGFCFSLGVIISFVPLSLIIWLHRDIKKRNLYNQMQEEDATPVQYIQQQNAQSNSNMFHISLDKQ